MSTDAAEISLILSLRSRLPSFSDRNVVELVAMLQLRKRVVRLVLDCWEWLVLRENLPALGIHGCNANFELKTVTSTKLGDNFTMSTAWRDQDAKVVLVYLAKNPEDINFALSLEKRPEDPVLGELLGYPKCCVIGYNEIVAGRQWVEKILDIDKINNLSLYANKLGYLFRGSPSFLPDYYPCSLSCIGSAALGYANYLGLASFGLKDLAQSMKLKLLRPIVHLPGLLAQLTGAIVDDRELLFDPALVRYYFYGFPDEVELIFQHGRISVNATQLNGYPCKVLTFADHNSLKKQ